MSGFDVQIPSAFDPFAEAKAEDSGAGSKEYVHIRIQQRNGRKSLTTVQGLKKEFSYNKILKDLKKEFCCNGKDSELGQLQGEQRKNVSTFLVQGEDEECLKEEQDGLAGSGTTTLLVQPSCIQGKMRDYQLASLNWMIICERHQWNTG